MPKKQPWYKRARRSIWAVAFIVASGIFGCEGMVHDDLRALAGPRERHDTLKGVHQAWMLPGETLAICLGGEFANTTAREAWLRVPLNQIEVWSSEERQRNFDLDGETFWNTGDQNWRIPRSQLSYSPCTQRPPEATRDLPIQQASVEPASKYEMWIGPALRDHISASIPAEAVIVLSRSGRWASDEVIVSYVHPVRRFGPESFIRLSLETALVPGSANWLAFLPLARVIDTLTFPFQLVFLWASGD